MGAELGAGWLKALRDVARLVLHEADPGRAIDLACARLAEAGGLVRCAVVAGEPGAPGDPAGDEVAAPILRHGRPLGALVAVRPGLGADVEARAALDEAARDLGHAFGRAAAVPGFGDPERLQRCVELLPAPVAVLDRGMRYLALSRRWREAFGPREGEYLGRSHYELFPDIPERWREVHRRCLTGQFAESMDDTFDRPDGRAEHLRWAIHPWWDAAGAVGGLFIHVEITTTRLATEAALLASQARLAEQAELLAETGAIAKVGGWELDVVTGGCTSTDEVARIHALAPGDPHGLEDGLRLYAGESRARLEAAIQAAIQRAAPYDLELELTTDAGVVKQVRAIGRPVAEGDRVVRLRGSIQDITDRKKIEAELIAERVRLRTLIDTLPDLVWLKDLAGRFLVCNRRFELLLGASEAEIIGKTDHDFVPRELADFFRENDRRAIAAGGPVTNDETLRFADGHEELVQTTKTPMLGPDGRLLGVLGIARDVTAARRADEALREVREQLLHSQKMEAVGTLAGGVAHDFNNLLTVISGFTTLALEDPALPGAVAERLLQVARASERAAGLTRQLLAFSRRLPTTPTVLGLGATVREMEKMLGRLIGEHLELQVKIDAGPSAILADPGQVEQVVMNLVVNARDACMTGGRITLEVAPARLDASATRLRPQVAPGPCVRLTVSDTGAGMDDRVKGRLFEPFFSTKAPGQGTGLGLATVYGILQQSRAGIAVESAPGRGARFDVYWPLVDAPVVAAPAPRTERRGGSETILLAEDEPSVRELVREVLASAGYRVLDGGLPLDVLERAAAHAGPIHLLLSDVVMPQLGGPELAARLHESRPGVPVLFMSGYPGDQLSGEPARVLDKPLRPAELLAAVRDTLDDVT
jgi:PAS domain S-box-containing protein